MTPISPDQHRAITTAVAEGFAEQTIFLYDLATIASRRGQEDAALDFMAQALEARGWQVDDWTVPLDDLADQPGFCDAGGEVPNIRSVVGTHDPGDAGGRSLILQGHLDVVPEGPLDMWSSPPFAPEIRDGWMYGRGAGDMKAGKAAALFAVDALRRAGFAPAGRLHYQSVVEEESTGLGALATLARGYRADCALIPEPTGHALVRAQVGVLWFRLRLAGRPAHVAYAGTGANAIMAAFHLITALQGMEARWNDTARNDPHFSDTPHPLNFNAGQIRGGDWTSSVPAWAEVDCRMGLLPGMDVEAAKAEIAQTVQSAAADHPFLADHPPDITWSGFQAPGYVLDNAAEPETVLRHAFAGAFDGQDMPERVFTGLTDTRFYGLYHGIPGLCIGPVAENIHAADERVSLDSVQRCTEMIALFIAGWCGLRPAEP